MKKLIIFILLLLSIEMIFSQDTVCSFDKAEEIINNNSSDTTTNQLSENRIQNMEAKNTDNWNLLYNTMQVVKRTNPTMWKELDEQKYGNIITEISFTQLDKDPYDGSTKYGHVKREISGELNIGKIYYDNAGNVINADLLVVNEEKKKEIDNDKNIEWIGINGITSKTADSLNNITEYLELTETEKNNIYYSILKKKLKIIESKYDQIILKTAMDTISDIEAAKYFSLVDCKFYVELDAMSCQKGSASFSMFNNKTSGFFTTLAHELGHVHYNINNVAEDWKWFELDKMGKLKPDAFYLGGGHKINQPTGKVAVDAETQCYNKYWKIYDNFKYGGKYKDFKFYKIHNSK